MKNLKKIENSLEKLHDDFNKQLEAIGTDSTEFHKALIELTAKYPDHKEIIHFIVSVNDRLTTQHSIFSEVLSDSFNELVKIKKDLLYNLIDDKQESSIKNTSFISKIKTFKDIKIILVTLSIIAIAVGVIFAPHAFLNVVQALAKIL